MTHLAERVHQLHPGPVKGLDVGDSRIATGGSDGVVRLLATNGEHLGSSPGHRDIVNDLAVDPAGRIVSGSRDRTIRLFDPGVGRSYVIGEHDHWVMTVAWSPDALRVVSGSEDGTVGVWEPEGASVTRVSLGRPVNAVDWRGDRIAAATGDGMLRILDPYGAITAELEGPRQIVWDVALSPDASRAAWVARDGTLRITGLDDGDTTVVTAHDDQAWGVAWDAAGERIVTTAADGTFAIWAPDGAALERVTVGPWLRRGRFRGKELYLATEEGTLAIYSTDGLPARTPIPITGRSTPEVCTHWDPLVTDAGPRPRCAECGSMDEARLCVTCGHVGCCESQLAHATKHWLETGHPNTIPVPAREFGWRWCYADDMYVKRV